MRCLSRIIKSAKVSLGNQMELDNEVVIKKENIQRINLNKETKQVDNKEIPKTQEEIEAIYMEEARKKSELFFNTEMQRAYNEGIENANNEAMRIVEEAKVQAEQIVFESMQLKNNVTKEYNDIMASMEKDIVDLVLEVSQKVIAKEIEKPDYILEIVADALDKSASKKDTILKVSDEDYDFIMKNKEKILLNVEGFGEVEVQKESSLANGSCVVETKFGIIDGGIETRMKQIEKEVLKILNR